jgi:hypothetical protein
MIQYLAQLAVADAAKILIVIVGTMAVYGVMFLMFIGLKKLSRQICSIFRSFRRGN